MGPFTTALSYEATAYSGWLMLGFPGRAFSRGLIAAWVGIACVVGDPTFLATSRVRSLTPELSKGLEFDLVVLIDPEAFGKGIEGAVDRYVAMTRATQQLVILTSS